MTLIVLVNMLLTTYWLVVTCLCQLCSSLVVYEAMQTGGAIPEYLKGMWFRRCGSLRRRKSRPVFLSMVTVLITPS